MSHDETFDEMVQRLSAFGHLVVPYDIPGGPPRGFVCNGATNVIDLDPIANSGHDHDYVTGRYSKLRSDWRYAWRLIKDKRPIWGLVRFLGLTAFGWPAWHHHRKRDSASRIEERLVTPGDYVWPVRTWLLDDLRPTPTRAYDPAADLTLPLR